MYKIEKTEYGFNLTFGGFIQAEEMQNWVKEAKEALGNQFGNFGVFVDMRNLRPLPEDSQANMQQGQKLFKQKGMQRSVVIVDQIVTKIQFKRIAQETGIYNWERYISAQETPAWQIKGLDWIKNAVDPDKVAVAA